MSNNFNTRIGRIINNIRYNHSHIAKILGKMYDIFNKGIVYSKRYDVLFEINKNIPQERSILFYAYEPKVTEYFISLLKQGYTVVDAGAWIGYYTLLAARKVGNGRVIAIEPFPANIARIEKHVKLNNLTNVTIINKAISNTSGTMKLELNDLTVLNRLTNYTSKHSIMVNIDTLDNILDELHVSNVDVLMMDIEGYEYNGLLGVKKRLSNKSISNMIIEVHCKYLEELSLSYSKLLELLKGYHYNIEVLEHIKDSIDRYHIVARYD